MKLPIASIFHQTQTITTNIMSIVRVRRSKWPMGILQSRPAKAGSYW